MRVAHIGPAPARATGPAGYLLQLQTALAASNTAHVVTFPGAAAETDIVARPRGPLSRLLGYARRVVTAERFSHPDPASLMRPGGGIDALITRRIAALKAEVEPSLSRAVAERADVLFAHDMAAAGAALDRRQRGQQVWLLMHSPMPLALDVAWNCGVPSADWREVLRYPDVCAWTQRELDVCARVDRLVLPCREALDELARCDGRFRTVLRNAEFVLPGADGPGGRDRATRAAIRARWRLPIDQSVGLFLGSAQPLDGVDALVDGLQQLRDQTAIPGMIAVASPDPRTVPVHDRIRALGRIDDLDALLKAVDFVVSVNRFSPFDLPLVEALRAGRALLLHDVGSNRTVRQLGAGVVSMADLAPRTVAAAIERFFIMPPRELDDLGARSRRCHEEHLTLEKFAARHIALYDRTAATGRPAPAAMRAKVRARQ